MAMAELIEESRTPDGWVFGTVNTFDGRAEVAKGVAFVEAPDGQRAGLLWRVGEPRFALGAFPSEVGWGVYSVTVERPVRTAAELGEALRAWLPELQVRYRELC